jgi:acyl carrier protein
MDDIKPRLINCFQTVFPDLPEQEIPSCSQASVQSWDSVAAITLVSVIEDEFAIQLDFDILPELDSFGRVHEYLSKATQSS